MQTNKAVSYTHLDVYKRQVHTSLTTFSNLPILSDDTETETGKPHTELAEQLITITDKNAQFSLYGELLSVQIQQFQIKQQVY